MPASTPATQKPTAAPAPAAAGDGAPAAPGPAEVEHLVLTHLPLVGHIVREMAARLPRHLDTDDLAGAGALALVQSARSFDPALGVPFGRFASTRIRGAMIDSMRSRDWATRSLRSRARMISEVSENLTAALHRSPTEDEIAAASGLSLEEVRGTRSGTDRASLLSLDPVTGAEDGLAGTVADPAPRPDEALVAAERMGYLRDALAELPARQRQVVTEYYLDQRPLTEIAEELGVTQSRASQLRAEGLDLLREALTALLHADARAGEGASIVTGAGARSPEGMPAGSPRPVPAPREAPAVVTPAVAAPGADGVRARRRAAYVEAVANRSDHRRRADVQAYLDGASLLTHD
ncbi:MAG: sigma-70 family RNA polymerase sigma factor [Kineosporiaceae bacterium]